MGRGKALVPKAPDSSRRVITEKPKSPRLLATFDRILLMLAGNDLG